MEISDRYPNVENTRKQQQMSYNFQTAKVLYLIRLLREIQTKAGVHVNTEATLARNSRGFIIDKIDELCERFDYLVTDSGRIDTGAGRENPPAPVIVKSIKPFQQKPNTEIWATSSGFKTTDQLVEITGEQPPAPDDIGPLLAETQGPEPIALDQWFKEGADLPPSPMKHHWYIHETPTLTGARVTFIDWQSPVVRGLFHMYVIGAVNDVWNRFEVAKMLGHIRVE